MPKKPTGITGIEPYKLGEVPAMDRPSIALGWFMDAMQIEQESGAGLILACGYCTESICDIEDGDTLRVLFNTALAHTC